LSNDRGILCKFKDSTSIAEGINRLLDEKFLSDVQRRAYKYSRRFLWKNVAKKYLNLINAITENRE
jgi:glycosyltransferase involved in cell wall biosynthesis